MEVGGRQGDENGERGTGQCRECLYRAHQGRPHHRPLVQHLLRVHARRLPQGTGGAWHQGGEVRLQHRQHAHHHAAILPGRALRLPAQLHGEHWPAFQAVHRFRDWQHPRQQGAVPRGDHHHHGSLHQQDAPVEGRAQTADMRGGVEGAGIGEHGDLHPVPLQDGAQVFRGGNRGDAGGGRHHQLTNCQGEHHQQLGLQDTSRPKEIYEQVWYHTILVGADGEGEVADTLHQHGEQPFKAL